MKLPHGKYLLFAKDLVEHTEKYIVVNCNFPMIPTLAMFLEAAAQCTAGFENEGNIKMGFLATGKEIKILNNINTLEYIMKLTRDISIGQYYQFSFEALAKDTRRTVVSGTLTLQIEA